MLKEAKEVGGVKSKEKPKKEESVKNLDEDKPDEEFDDVKEEPGSGKEKGSDQD
jgi:hypothetical protein